jgi:hypothetical protein
MKRLLLLAALALSAPIYSQTLNFTVETSTSNGTSIVPRLTWTTTPAGAVCGAVTTPASNPATLDPQLLAELHLARSDHGDR